MRPNGSFALREYPIPAMQTARDADAQWVRQWHGMPMLRESFSPEALSQHANVFDGPVRIAYALEAYAMLSILDCYPDEQFMFMELGSGRAPWCLTVAGAIRHQLVNTPPRDCFVIALEADPTHYVWSKLHLNRGNINGEALHGAIGSAPGRCRFRTMPDPAASMGQHVSENGQIVVPVFTIDQLLAQRKIAHVHAVHMDVQGQEVEAIRGARNSLKDGMIDFLIIGTHSRKIETELKALLAPTHRVVAELPIGGQVALPGFSCPFRSTDDGVLVFMRS